MYSVVMATMLAAGTTTPAWHHHHHRCYTSCYSCYSCYSSCYSCYSSCHGCYSGCHTYRHHHCHGCYSYGCSSCSCYSCYSGYAGYSGYYCSGCSCSCTIVYYSSCSVCSTCSICCTTEAAPRVIEVPAKKTERVPVPKQNQNQNEESVSTVQKSRVTVVLPADAKLWVDNVECPLTSNVRSFDTPNLNANQQYVYNLRMEVVRNGQTVVQNQRAIITPGQPVQVDFNQGAVATASR